MNTSLAVVDVNNGEYLGSITGMMPNIRHILVKDGYIYLAITNLGYIQRGKIDAVIDSLKNNKLNITQWENIYVGKGIRTMEISEDGLYLFAAVNEESKIAIVDLSKLQTICKIDADSFPVGLDITKDKNYLIVTAQGKYGIGGNSVMVYKVDYKNKN
jgi:DNA-binding beta-propeller fold protein YncE